MKSIVEEASSIAKAIENGWVRAGKPEEFTIRIFEEPEKNFLGFNKKPAKVGIFYNEAPVQQHSQGKDSRRQQPRPQASPKSSPERLKSPQKPPLERKQMPPVNTQPQPQKSEQTTLSDQQKSTKWTPELVDGSKEWINTMLKSIAKENVPFTVTTKQYFITIRFANPLISDKRKEQLLFKNWSYLLLQVLRHKYKRGLRGYKIIITSAA